jgi:hypothetical protein
MNLPIAAPKPASAAGTQSLGLCDFFHAEHGAVELSRSGLATRGSRNLNVINARNPWIHTLQNITVR